MASLCESCRRYDMCDREVTITENRVILGNRECMRCTDHDQLTRADFAAKDAEIAKLKRNAAGVPPWNVNEFAKANLREGAYFERDVRNFFNFAEIGYNHAAANVVPRERILTEDKIAVDRARLEQLGGYVKQMDELSSAGKPVGKLTWAALDHFNALTETRE